MIYAGTIIEIDNNKTYVFTMDYSMVTIRTRKDYFPGQQITFTKKDKYIDLYLLKPGTLKALVLAAALIVLVVSVALSGSLRSVLQIGSFDEVCTALVSVDINPSIEISINKKEQIVDVRARNEDGKKILSSLELKSKKLTEGVNEIVSAAKAMGYINAGKNVVLVSAAVYETTDTSDNSYAKQLQQILSSLENSDDSTNVLTVFIDDPTIIENANNNDLSLGKELLYQYAISQNGNLTADDIRTGSINELLDKLNGLEQDGKLSESIKSTGITSAYTSPTPTEMPAMTITPTVNATPTPQSTATPSPEPTATMTPTPTPEPTPTPKPTPKPVADGFDPNLSVSIDGAHIDFDWTPIPSSNVTYHDKVYKGFHYYKVVASSTNDHPSYPDDGYLAVLSDPDSSDWSCNPSDGDYNLSPELLSDRKYYFSITYVFENGKFTSDTEVLTVPQYNEEEPESSLSSLELSVTSKGGSLYFNWTPVNSSSIHYYDKVYKDFNFYKIVASETNPKPKYPADGYLTYISDYYADSWNVNPYEDSYNYDPELVSGTTYYFSITYVFSNGSLSSNTVSYTVP